MALVIDGLLVLAIIVAVVWLWGLKNSAAGDAAAAREREREADEVKRQAEREKHLARTGERLRCLGCDADFRGPLTDTGCPQCHLSSLVVTEDEYRRQTLTAGRETEENNAGD